MSRVELLLEIEEWLKEAEVDLDDYYEGEWAPDHRDWKNAHEKAMEFARLLKEEL